jgi:hypothetical protein
VGGGQRAHAHDHVLESHEVDGRRRPEAVDTGKVRSWWIICWASSAATRLPPLPRAGPTKVVEGRPATELARRSADLDLLIVGSRGHGPVRRFLLGSTSSRLVREASCPVLIVPRPAPP